MCDANTVGVVIRSLLQLVELRVRTERQNAANAAAPSLNEVGFYAVTSIELFQSYFCNYPMFLLIE